MTALTASEHRQGAASAVAIDLVERAVLLGLFVRLLINNYHAVMSSGHWFNWLMVLSEGLGVLFVMIRKPARQVSDRPSEWAIAFAATAGPLLVHAQGSAPIVPLAVGLSFLIFGILTQIAAKLELRRSFGVVAANRGVKVAGAYRFVRHPMYLGYACVHVGFLLLTPSLWNLAVYAASFGCQLIRILAEERVLGQDPKYRTFQREVRYRLVPGVF